MRLPAVVGEGLVGLGHAVRVFALLHRVARVVERVEQFRREPLGHGLLAALARELDDPPERQRLPEGALPQVQAGLPASLLGQRPDLQAAEQRLKKYLANVDTTRASYYPSFTLTGTLGTSSTSLVEVVKNPYAALGAGLALPFIQWNTMRLHVETAQADYEEAVVNFRQTLYAALGDVENALAARKNYAEEIKQLQDSLDLAKKAEQLAEVRYLTGSTDLQTWLDTQERRRDAERAFAVVRLAQLKNSMTVYQVFGGTTSLQAP